MNGFNPTFSDTNSIIDYNINDKVRKGSFDPNLIYGKKFKIVTFNSNLNIKGVNFTEVSYQEFSSHSLFYLSNGEYKNLTLENCYFDLKLLVALIQEGGNFKIFNSVFNIARITTVARVLAKTECSIYRNNWISNNFLMDNCTFNGISSWETQG